MLALSSNRRKAERTPFPAALRALLGVGLGWCSACSAGGPSGSQIGDNSGSNGAPPTGDPNQVVTGLVTDPELGVADECDGVLPVVYRDFSEAHPDFEMEFRGDVVRRKLIAPTLGADGKPSFLSSTGCPAQQGTPTACANWMEPESVITSAQSFDQWYRTTPGTNFEFPGELTLTETPPESGQYIFNSNEFFPIPNDQGFGITPQGSNKNFLFTTEIHLNFQYIARQRFKFRGDDDLWIFVNGTLALDLGSLHGAEEGEIDFDAQAATLGIVPGRAYAMDIFHAERHTDQSNFSFETNIACFTPSILR
jgi:fibro-slime domain-containing protein